MNRKIKIALVAVVVLVVVALIATYSNNKKPVTNQEQQETGENKAVIAKDIEEKNIKDFTIQGEVIKKNESGIVVSTPIVVKEGEGTKVVYEEITVMVTGTTKISKYETVNKKQEITAIKLSELPINSRVTVDTKDNPLKTRELTAARIIYAP